MVVKNECQFERSNVIVVVLVLSIFNSLATLLILLGFLYFGFPAK